MSTAHSYSTTSNQAVVYDPQTEDHAMYLDEVLVGFARTAREAQTILDQIGQECRSGRPFTVPIMTIPPTFPLPPSETVAESLNILSTHDDNPAIYIEAARQLAAGVTIGGTGADRLVDGVLVRRAPLLECWPWPWHCACGEERCWHGALLDGILFAWERLGDDPRPLPFDAAA